MNPGYKIICINTGALEFIDSTGSQEVLPPTPELTIGKVYTVEKVLLAKETNFSFDRVILMEEKGHGMSAYNLRRFDLYGM